MPLSTIVQLGVISYSVYLPHPLGYAILGNALDEPLAEQVSMPIAGLVFAVVIATLSHRYLEHPFIQMGKRVAERERALLAGEEFAGVPIAERPPA